MFGAHDITPTRIAGGYRLRPVHHHDNRGFFLEGLRSEPLSEIIGYPFRVRQSNFSVSQRNTVRGIHSTSLPPGQAKLVTCVRGAVLDVAVDLRVGSPTFGMWETTEQDEDSLVSVYLADGLGHAFQALTDDACMNYLCSEAYVPGTMINIDPFDADLAIPWNLDGPPIMSEKDARATALQDAVDRGLLPSFQECLEHYRELGAGAMTS